MKISSNSFNNLEMIPKKFGYKYENLSPSLVFDEIPKNAESLVLIMDDPDAMQAVGKIWVHWILINIPPTTKIILENSIPKNCIQGKNDFNEIGYGGPAPPDKEHTYVFRLYALSEKLEFNKEITRTALDFLMKEKIISTAELKGRFSP